MYYCGYSEDLYCGSNVCRRAAQETPVTSDTPPEFRGYLEEFNKLSAIAQEANIKLALHVACCTHPKEYVKKVPNSISSSGYWYDCSCSLCNSHWMEVR